MSTADALQRAVDALRGAQSEEGYWWGHMHTNVTLDVEDLLIRELYGVGSPERTAAAAAHIRGQQREDGTWAIYPGGPGQLSTSVEAYLGLRLAGDPASAPHMLAAARFCREQGGLAQTRMVTRIWLALLGLWPWDELPALPPEIMFTPDRAPLSVSSLSAWSRVALIPLAMVRAHRPVHPVSVSLDELMADQATGEVRYPRFSVQNAFVRTDVVLRRYEHHPIRRVRAAALRRAESWLLAHQETDGTWNGVHLLSVFALLGLWAAGYPVDHPVVRKTFTGLERFEIWDEGPAGPSRRIECVTGPVWDTSLAVLALADAGVPATDPAQVAAVDWLLGQEVSHRGDWTIRRRHLIAGAWTFSFVNDQFPDSDDTATVVLGLRRTGPGGPEEGPRAQARARGTAWLVGMQGRTGGWGSFDADSTSKLADKLPFCDWGEATDAPSADVTAHVLEALAHELPVGHPTLERGLSYLLREQESDGSWFGRWSANYIWGTCAAMNALAALAAGGTPAEGTAMAAGARWLRQHQNPDGGWGEDLRSYEDDAWRGRGDSTPSQTSWALMGLHAAGATADDESVRRGLDWLVDHQLPDGTWTETAYTGTGFPGDFYMGYPMYRMIYPVAALGRYRVEPDPASESEPGTSLGTSVGTSPTRISR